MERFKFRLDKVLDIRKDREEESKISFKKAQDDRKKVESKLYCLKEDYDKFNQWDKEEGIYLKRVRNTYLTALSENIEDTESELQYRKNKVEEKRKDLVLKQRERKTVEILKEKKYEEYLKEENRLETLANDEFALYGYIRKTYGQ